MRAAGASEYAKALSKSARSPDDHAKAATAHEAAAAAHTALGGRAAAVQHHDIEDTDLEAELAEFAERTARRIAKVREAFAASPAVIAVDNHRRVLLIQSDEPGDRRDGILRVSEFHEDGPWGHTTARTADELYDRVSRDYGSATFTPATDEDVIRWTSTPAFIRGSALVAYTQADNSYRYLAHRAGVSNDEIATIEARARGHLGTENQPSLGDLGKATAVLERAIKVVVEQHPGVSLRRNPSRDLVANPPWVTEALADSYDIIDKKVPPEWLPAFATVTKGTGSTLVASMLEYGCGAYGCVIATLDPKTVLKVTSDESEAEFAAQLSVNLAAPICVEYKMVIRLADIHEGRQVHLLWREAAEHVGGLRKAIGGSQGKLADDLVHAQHRAAQNAYTVYERGARERDVRRAVAAWLEACEVLARGRVPELRLLGRGLIEVYETQGILFGDIHVGNLGMVTRDGIAEWVITDPGHVAVVA